MPEIAEYEITRFKEGEAMFSVCIIAKNEEKNIARCLKSLQPLSCEIVVVDTGSVDATKEIAARYTENIYDYVWEDDFAAAKNYAIERASNPYVLVLDSDEFVEHFDKKQLEQQLRIHPNEVGRIKRVNYLTKNGEKQEQREWINRIFSKEAFHYEGRIHEQVTARDGDDYGTYQAPVVIGHTGYDLTEEEKTAKAARNYALLQQEYARLMAQVEEQGFGLPGQPPEQEQLPYIIYQLGKSSYLAGEYMAACGHFSEALSYDLNPKLEYVIDMVETYGYALLNSGQAETALLLESVYAEFGDSADFKFLMGLIYMNNARFDEAIGQFEAATAYADCRSKGVNSYAAWYNIGVICECLGDVERARSYYRRCGDYAPARKRL